MVAGLPIQSTPPGRGLPGPSLDPQNAPAGPSGLNSTALTAPTPVLSRGHPNCEHFNYPRPGVARELFPALGTENADHSLELALALDTEPTFTISEIPGLNFDPTHNDSFSRVIP